MTKTSPDKTFMRLYASFRDAKSCYEKYHKTTYEIMQSSSILKRYLADWYVDEGVSRLKELKQDVEYDFIGRSLHFLDREIAIYSSRLKYLKTGLGICEEKLKAVSALLKETTMTKRVKMVNECVDSVIQWSNKRRDFEKCHRRAMASWKSVEERIIEILLQVKPEV